MELAPSASRNSLLSSVSSVPLVYVVCPIRNVKRSYLETGVRSAIDTSIPIHPFHIVMLILRSTPLILCQTKDVCC